MNFSNKNMVSVGEILRDVTKLTLDMEYRAHNKGYYVSLISQALEELAFDTQFLEESFEVDVPHNLVVDMPGDSFNVMNIFLYNGPICNIGSNTTTVYWKRNFFTRGKGYLARNKPEATNDPFYNGNVNNPRIFAGGVNSNSGSDLARGRVFFYNIQDGRIMLSSECRRYEHLYIQLSMIPDLDSTPIIPKNLRQAVKLWSAEQALIAMVVEDPRFQSVLAMVSSQLHGIPKLGNGAWAKARSRTKEMDAKARHDMEEYWQKLPY